MTLLEELRRTYIPSRPTDPTAEAFGSFVDRVEDYLARVEAAKARPAETADEARALIGDLEELQVEGVMHLITAVRAFDPRGVRQ